MALLDDIKLVMRISSTAYDDEINDCIDAAKAEMGLVGINDDLIVATDALVKGCIITYVKANFGWDNPDAERWQRSYEMRRNHLSLSREYGFYIIKFDVGDRAEITLDDETKDTNALGEVTFYRKKQNNVDYKVVAEGYKTEEDTIDISENTTITLVLVAI
jgi:hypothetical protein